MIISLINKKLKLNIIYVCCFLCQTAESQEIDNFIGFWANEEKTITIEIYKLEKSYYGKLLKTSFSEKSRNTNDDIIIQMKKRSNKVLFGGTYFDLNLNQSYEIKLRLVDSNHFYLKRFYKFLNKRHHWHRIKN